MEAIYALHVPSIFSYQQSIAEDPTGESLRNYHCSEMANPNMVARLDENADRESSTTTQQKETAVSSKKPSNDSPSASKTGAADVPLVWRSLESQGISTEASRIIMQSWRSGTTTQYQTYHKRWESFCCRRNINPLQATLQDGINFLGDLFATGVGYSCINTARSALSSIIVLPGSVHFGSHPLVTRFVEGVFETRPSLPRYKEIWDVNSVLRVLATWSLRDMSWKLTMLLAILSGQRVQTLKALTLTSMTLTANKCVFTIDTPLKTTRPGKHIGRIEFLAYEPDWNLCVVQHLQDYIDRTSHLRGETDQLLIGYQKPHKPVATNTIARWLKNVMAKAGIDTSVYKAHSPRAAVTSAAKGKKQVPIDTILSTAGWNSESTFARSYDKPIRDTAKNFGHELLHNTC